MATPVWNGKQWRLDVRINGRRRLFTSTKAGKPGLADVRRKYNLALEGESDKAGWRIEKCWSEYLIDVDKRTGKGENYAQRDKYGRLYILPEVGYKKIGQTTTADWQRCINNAKPTRKSKKTNKLICNQLSKKTLKNLMGTITDFCGFAMRSRMINAMPAGLYVPRMAPVVGKEILQPDQLKAVYDGASAYWYGNAWLLMVVTGFRPGEVYGLQASDIKDGVIYIRRAINSRREITKGKNKRAQREHVLNEYSLAIIEAQKEKLRKARIVSPWLFPAQDADIPSPHRSYKQWKKFSNAIGIDTAPYSLRHTHYSIMKEMPEAWLKLALGHGQDMDTFGVYGHTVNDDLQKASVKAAEILGRHLPKKEDQAQ